MVRFRLAKHPSDVPRLQRFTCAKPTHPRGEHPEPWATEVQSWFRGDALKEARKASPHADQRLLLFESGDSEHLLGVSAHVIVSGLVAITGDDSRLLLALAVSYEMRGQPLANAKGRLADLVLDWTLQDIRDAPSAVDVVWCRIHPRNVRSLRLAARHGFQESLDDTALADGYIVFTRRLS